MEISILRQTLIKFSQILIKFLTIFQPEPGQPDPNPTKNPRVELGLSASGFDSGRVEKKKLLKKHQHRIRTYYLSFMKYGYQV